MITKIKNIICIPIVDLLFLFINAAIKKAENPDLLFNEVAQKIKLFPTSHEKQLQITMLVKINGAFTKKERSGAEQLTSEKS